MRLFSYFEKRLNPFPPEPPVTPPNSIYQFCRHYVRGMEWALVIVSLTSVLIAVGEVVLFGFVGQLVDWMGKESPDEFWSAHTDTLIWMSILILLILPALVLIDSLVSNQTVMGNFPMIVRWMSHRYMLNQSMGFFQNEFAGRIATKVMQTALAVRDSVLKIVDLLVYVSVYFLSIVVLVGQSDWRLTLPLLAWLVVYAITLRNIIPRFKRIAEKQADARSVMTGRVVDSYTNVATVKLFSHATRESDYAKDGMQRFLDTVHPQMRLATVLELIIWSSNALLVFSTAALSIWLWSQGSIGVGIIAVSTALTLRLNGMSHWVMWEVSSLFENLGTVQDGVNTLARDIDVTDTNSENKLVVSEGAISFENTCFAYGDNPPVFNDLNLNIGAGEKVGLVGRSGAGKSTLVNLLLRFYDVQSGAIKLDGQDISQVSQESLRAAIGMVTQDTSLLHRSVRDNILYGRDNASEEEMIAATHKAEAFEFIQELADIKGRKAFDAIVGERGVNLSGGQRQRIAIARVMLKNAPILVLDEATSALDSEAEAAIQKSLNRLMENKTVIAIAHRLSTIAMMDRLIVIDRGRIVESGTHQELVDQNGIYATLWRHQSGGFIGDGLELEPVT